jgi:hypothetical protein
VSFSDCHLDISLIELFEIRGARLAFEQDLDRADARWWAVPPTGAR